MRNSPVGHHRHQHPYNNCNTASCRPCKNASLVRQHLLQSQLSPLLFQAMQQSDRPQGGRQRHKRHFQSAAAGAPPGLQQRASEQLQHSATGFKQAKTSPDAKSAGSLPAAAFIGQANGAASGSLQHVRTSSTTRAHLTDVHFRDLAICEATKR